MASLSDEKAAARKAAFSRRKAAHGSGDHTGVLAEVLDRCKGRVIAGYMPIRTEIDPRPVMAALSDSSTICVPVIQAEGAPLVFHRWTPETEMIAGPFGAAVPAVAEVVEPDVLIVPLVAFTRRCERLGYGGGFYDRTLPGLRQKRPTEAYGFAYGAQEADRLPMEETDAPLTAIVTEATVHWAPGHPKPWEEEPWPWPVPY